jgi:N-acetylmuramoyl-L-alanine amidase
VYALSQKGATSAQARVLADRENASDLIGGVDLGQTDDILAKVLVDMSQTATISSSLELGQDLLTSLGGVGPVHVRNVGQAGFAVLKSPVMPSILVETTFISHPGEERKLRSREYRKKMARAIYEGIRRFAKRNRLRPRSSDASYAKTDNRRVHVVRRGDTLSDIAQRYQVNVSALRFANDIQGNSLSIGKRLVIPN